jgi:hypothetical protein
MQVLKDFNKQYGDSFMVLNVHLLQHTMHFVSGLGSIKYYWCFPSENMLGYIKGISL